MILKNIHILKKYMKGTALELFVFSYLLLTHHSRFIPFISLITNYIIFIIYLSVYDYFSKRDC